jgi:hypothetical protein
MTVEKYLDYYRKGEKYNPSNELNKQRANNFRTLFFEQSNVPDTPSENSEIPQKYFVKLGHFEKKEYSLKDINELHKNLKNLESLYYGDEVKRNFFFNDFIYCLSKNQSCKIKILGITLTQQIIPILEIFLQEPHTEYVFFSKGITAGHGEWPNKTLNLDCICFDPDREIYSLIKIDKPKKGDFQLRNIIFGTKNSTVLDI